MIRMLAHNTRHGTTLGGFIHEVDASIYHLIVAYLCFASNSIRKVTCQHLRYQPRRQCCSILDHLTPPTDIADLMGSVQRRITKDKMTLDVPRHNDNQVDPVCRSVFFNT